MKRHNPVVEYKCNKCNKPQTPKTVEIGGVKMERYAYNTECSCGGRFKMFMNGYELGK